MKADELLGLYLKGERSFAGVDLSGAQLVGAELIGVDLTDANLSRADLTGADLTGANLTRTNLTGATLNGILADNTCFQDTILPTGERWTAFVLVNEGSDGSGWCRNPVDRRWPPRWLAAHSASQRRLRKLAWISPELARIVVQNPNCGSRLLKKLSHYPDEQVRKGVFTHPKTPSTCILALHAEFADELAVALLKAPPDELPISTLTTLIEHQCGSLTFLERVEQCLNRIPPFPAARPVLEALAKNPETPSSVLVRLARGPLARYLLRHLLRHPNIDGPTLAALARFRLLESQMEIAGYPATLPTTLEQLAYVAPDVDRLIAAHPATPHHVLEQLSFRTDSNYGRDIRINVARNPGSSWRILERLIQDSHEWVRTAVLENPALPWEEIQARINYLPESVLAQLARHPAIPGTFLQVLAENPGRILRGAVARHSQTPLSMLESWMDGETWLRAELAHNPKLPAVWLEKLAQDASAAVRVGVACNPATPAGLLRQLACDPDRSVRLGVAKNHQSPGDVLEVLFQADPGNANLFEALLAHPHLPGSVLEDMATRWPRNRQIARHPNATSKLKEKILGKS
ncbi:MAG TPA: pentapeptide repeat-containing protein [Acidobacteriota bacterium]|nr:pentapeptide repeat-containing protein [Acidobacteriota bacterium]